MRDDLMSPNFSGLSLIRHHTRAYLISVESYRSSWSYLITPTYRMHTEMMTCSFSYHDPSMEPIWSHSAKPTFFGNWLSSCFLFQETFPKCLGLIWIMEITCLMRDDLMSPDFSNLSHIRCHTRAYFRFD